jgi:hypothetical protein
MYNQTIFHTIHDLLYIIWRHIYVGSQVDSSTIKKHWCCACLRFITRIRELSHRINVIKTTNLCNVFIHNRKCMSHHHLTVQSINLSWNNTWHILHRTPRSSLITWWPTTSLLRNLEPRKRNPTYNLLNALPISNWHHHASHHVHSNPPRFGMNYPQLLSRIF